MKNLIALILLFCAGTLPAQKGLVGAWTMKDASGNIHTLILTDHYLTDGVSDKDGKNFVSTQGGTYTFANGKMVYMPEFNSAFSEKVGQSVPIGVKASGSRLALTGELAGEWTRLDDATGVPMAGVWHITERADKGTGPLIKIHQTGTRKTIKVLSAGYFQWIAIDPAVKGFYGTGAGTYTAANGRYTENIRLFSRDNSRVGASLGFNWKLENGKWDHSGNSSKGDPIHETWEKVK